MEHSLMLKEVYERYFHHLQCDSYKLTKDWQYSEDIVQQAIIKTYDRIPWDKFTHFITYLRNTVHNMSINHTKVWYVRKKKRWPDIDFPEQPTFEEDVRARVLKIFIDELPDCCRQIMVLLFFHEMDLKHVANYLHLNISTVKTQKARGLELLRAKFGVTKEQCEANNKILIEKIKKRHRISRKSNASLCNIPVGALSQIRNPNRNPNKIHIYAKTGSKKITD